MASSGRGERRRAAATLVVVVALGAFVHPGPAAAHPECDPETGVRVVVDQGPLSGGANVRCVEDGADRPVAEVMAEAGVEITWVQRYPGALVCRLDGRPRDLPCADTPPPDRYWGLFWAGPGDRRWTYAAEGAGSLTVPGGGAVGWRFQDGRERKDPAHALDALPLDGGSGGTTDSAGTQDPPSDQAGDEVAGSRSTLMGLLLVAGLCVGGFLVVRRRT